MVDRFMRVGCQAVSAPTSVATVACLAAAAGPVTGRSKPKMPANVSAVDEVIDSMIMA
jgi:hypothetical protein